MASDDRSLKGQSDVPNAGAADVETTRRPAPSAAAVAHPIFVLGMHRSGTSAIARVLNLMGAYVGETPDLMPPHARDNPAGYWERRELVIAHDNFLQATGHAWDRVAGFDASAHDGSAVDQLAVRLNDVAARMSSHCGPWLIKDPRLCLLLPQWLGVAADAACVVVVRDPREIAASMRESHRGVYTSHFLLALWEKYLRSALHALSGKRVLFVSYQKLLAEPEAQSERLRKGLQTLGVVGLHTATSADLSSIDVKLRRSAAKAHMELSAPQRGLFAWLEQQCALPGTADTTGFPEGNASDAVLREFERTLDDNAERARAAALGESAQRIAQLETAIAQQHARLISEIGAHREQLRLAHAESANLGNELRRAAVDIANLQSQTANLANQLHTEGTRHRSHVEQLQSAHDGLLQHANALDQRAQAMRRSLSWTITAPLRGIANLFALRLSWNLERSLYRAYYAMPGLSGERKRALIEWIHRRAGWMTRNTLSYKMHTQAQQLREQRRADPAAQHHARRMDQNRADAVLATLTNPPLISIVLPVYNVERRWLSAAVESVRRQFYPHWQLCIADDASSREETRQVLAELAAAGDKRIKIRRLEKNVGIAAASNAALDLASGDYVGFLDNDDELSRDALIEMAQRIVADGADLLYSDEDKLEEDGRHSEPHFKPDYSPDYLFSINYVCHFSVVRRSLLKAVGGFRAGFEGAQDFDLLLRITERTDKISHIPKILYHWRKIEGSTAKVTSAKPQASDAGRRALAESLARRGIAAKVEPGPFPTSFHVRRAIAGQPLVSIIVPFRDKPELLEACATSILQKSRYPHFEFIGVDNDSTEEATREVMRDLQTRDARVHFIRYDKPFNYPAINNFAVRHAHGEHLLFLNNDTKVISADWLDALLEHSQRPEVGVVGAKLLYADDTLQHTGVIAGIGGVAGHPHLFLPAQDPGYFARAQVTQNLSAVTFACAMTRRDVFERLGGLNERDLPIAFNDVDYCLRVREAGHLIVYTPNAVLYHYESKSRGYEDNPEKQKRFAAETAYIQQRHAQALKNGDPYYNPNLSLMHAFVPADDYVATLPV